MTLAFGILPGVARDFSFMIQSAGMTAAAATIAIMQVQVETHSIFYATIGGACGLALGLEQVSVARKSCRYVLQTNVENEIPERVTDGCVIVSCTFSENVPKPCDLS